MLILYAFACGVIGGSLYLMVSNALPRLRAALVTLIVDAVLEADRVKADRWTMNYHTRRDAKAAQDRRDVFDAMTTIETRDVQ